MGTRFFRTSVALASLLLATGMTLPARAVVPADVARRANATSAGSAVSTTSGAPAFTGAQAERLPIWCRPLGGSWLLGLCVL